MAAVVALAASLTLCPAATPADPRLVILTETGLARDGFPVLSPHPDPERVTQVLTRGMSGKLLSLYRYEQEYLRRETGAAPEPGYLLLSNQRGGFPRFGFFLEGQDKRQAGFVDLHKTSRLTGRFGSMDQIFPHELAHIIVRQLAGGPHAGGSNQMHAIGVRTDPGQAFQEGFAEHLQVMAVEDPEADPETRALAADDDLRSRADLLGQTYGRELAARWAVAGPMRMGFLFWFGGTEQAWRYFAVKANAFAHQVPIPEALLVVGDPYPAYLLANTIPGDLSSPPRPVRVMLATEGVISTLFYRWAVDPALRERYREDAFYGRFGAAKSGVTPMENVYLKMFHALYRTHPKTAEEFIQGYESTFPDETGLVESLVAGVLLGQSRSPAPALWLANRDFQTGTSLFDQYRSLPRTHTFDLNAATHTDLAGVPGMTRQLAESILRNGPYADVADLGRVAGMPPGMIDRFLAMAREMERRGGESGSSDPELGLGTILWSYLRRALIILAAAAGIGAALYRRLRPVPWWRALLNGAAASLLTLALAWITTGTGPLFAWSSATILFGLPPAAWQAAVRRRPGYAGLILLAWGAAAVPATLLAYPWF